MNRKIFLIFTFGLCFSAFAQEKTAEKAFHFNHYQLEKSSIISASELNHSITEKDRISVSEDGHLEADGKRLRIFGTNISEFPISHQQAEFSAQSLANQGYNCIRFHHTDASWSNCFLKKGPDDSQQIDYKRVDDFDYFFAQLKLNGIYSNINFLTGRTIRSADGYKKEIDSYSDMKSAHLLGLWDKEALEKQKEWALFLMNHVNPYTGIAYKDDPAVAIVEINNENGLLMGYLNGWLEEVNGEYWQELEDQWNEWLINNEVSVDELEAKYNKTSPKGEYLIDNNSRWNLEQHDSAKAKVSKVKSQHTIQVTANGSASWHVQYNCPNLNMQDSKIYTLKFSAKASKDSSINVSLMEAHSPWQNSGFNKDVKLNKNWQEFTFCMENIRTDSNIRLNFGSMGKSAGTTFNIKDVELYEGGERINIQPGYKSSASEKTIALPHYSEYIVLPDELKTLIMSFLYDKEEAYWLTMKDFVRNEIKTKALIMGTAVSCSTAAIQSCYDIIDTHAYWHHPNFPVSSWDSGHYYVKNQTLTKADENSTLTSLARSRVYGMPFSVSEYDHPYPSSYSSEMYPMIAAFGCLQDWDCIFTFCSELPYNDKGKNQKIRGYFDQSNNPSKSCAAPFAARIFRQFLVKSAETKTYVNVNRELEKSAAKDFRAWDVSSPSLYGSIPQASLFYQLGLNLEGITKEEILVNGIDLNKDSSSLNSEIMNRKSKGFSDTKEIYWDQNSGLFIVCNPDVTITVADTQAIMPEFPEEWKKEGILEPPCPQSDFIAVMAVKDKITTENQEPYLIYSCSWSGNKNERLTTYGNKASGNKLVINRTFDAKLTTDASLGTGPVVCLASECNFKIPGENWNLFLADIKGNSKQKIEKTSDGCWNVKIGCGSLWFVLSQSN